MATVQTNRFAVEPELVPIDAKHEELISLLCGCAGSTLFEINKTAPGVVRVKRGQTENGHRYFLHVPSFRRYAASLPPA